MDNIRQWLVDYKSLSDDDRLRYKQSNRPELLREIRQCLLSEDEKYCSAVIGQLFQFSESRSSHLQLFVHSIIPCLTACIIRSSIEIHSGIETLSLLLYNAANLKSTESKEILFPSTNRDTHSIYFNPGVMPGTSQKFKFHYKRISYKDKVLSADRDEVASVLFELFREKMFEMDDLILKECCLVLEDLIFNQSDVIDRFPLFLHSVTHLIFQMHHRFNPNHICNRLQERIKVIAENELHIELLLVSNSVCNILHAMIENKSDELANFMSTPDLRQCRAVKNVNLKIVGYDKNDEKNEDYLVQMKAIKKESFVSVKPEG